MESEARGGTRWRRFGLVMVPSVAATAAIGLALAQGALAASFSVSGQEFKVRVDYLDGRGFNQYGTIVSPSGSGSSRPVAVSAFDTATIEDLCQSVVVPTPIGDVTVRITAGTDPDNPVTAENLFIDLEQLNAQAVFTNIDIGVAVHELEGPDPVSRVDPNSFGQQSDRAQLWDVEQVAWATSAGTFRLTDLSLSLHRGSDEECF